LAPTAYGKTAGLSILGFLYGKNCDTIRNYAKTWQKLFAEYMSSVHVTAWPRKHQVCPWDGVNVIAKTWKHKKHSR